MKTYFVISSLAWNSQCNTVKLRGYRWWEFSANVEYSIKTNMCIGPYIFILFLITAQGERHLGNLFLAMTIGGKKKLQWKQFFCQFAIDTIMEYPFFDWGIGTVECRKFFCKICPPSSVVHLEGIYCWRQWAMSERMSRKKGTACTSALGAAEDRQRKDNAVPSCDQFYREGDNAPSLLCRKSGRQSGNVYHSSLPVNSTIWMHTRRSRSNCCRFAEKWE